MAANAPDDAGAVCLPKHPPDQSAHQAWALEICHAVLAGDVEPLARERTYKVSLLRSNRKAVSDTLLKNGVAIVEF